MWKLLRLLGFIFEYQTPRVVTIRHYKLGIFRLLLQLCILAFIFIFQLWYKMGYQTFSEVEASVTTKVKGVAYSMPSERKTKEKISERELNIYQRVWDVADFVIPPSENNAFFVLTNAIITPNQTRNVCPEDPTEMPDVICRKHGRFVPPETNHDEQNLRECSPGRIRFYTSHGSETGRCVRQDRQKTKEDTHETKEDVHVCEISGWCPVEHDLLLMDKEPLIPNTEYFTVLIKNAISFPWFDPLKYKRNNMPNGVCLFNPDDKLSWTCPIFRLGDIIALAGGNYTKLATKGAVIAIEIKWDCNLDFDFMSTCLPKYDFHILDDSGWNFRHALYHEEHRRTLVKAYGIKFLITVNGKAGKFDITRTVVIIVTGLGLMGLANIMCDLVLLKSSNRYREQIAEKKFEQIDISGPGDEKADQSLLYQPFNGIRKYSMKIVNNNSSKATTPTSSKVVTTIPNPLHSESPDVTQTIPLQNIEKLQSQIEYLESDL